MSRTDDVKAMLDHINSRDFDADIERFASDLRWHAPGLGVESSTRDEMLRIIERFTAQADVHYDVHQVLEQGPFVVAFARSEGVLDGRQMTWELCQVLRYEGDRIVEVWTLRGGEPVPTGA